MTKDASAIRTEKSVRGRRCNPLGSIKGTMLAFAAEDGDAGLLAL
jgi:hypothetical protein